jgi:hypothetical protein
MTRIVVGLILLAAIIEGLAPGAVPMDLLPLALVVLGLLYGWTAVDSDDPGTYMLVTLAVVAAATMPGGGGGDGNGVLGLIPAVGGHLDAILDQAVAALLAGVVSVFVQRTISLLQG